MSKVYSFCFLLFYFNCSTYVTRERSRRRRHPIRGQRYENNRDFQISRKIFQSVIGKILSCYSSSAPNSLAISSDFLICSIKTLREGSSVMYWATLIPALSSWRSSICSPSTRRRHCQIELYS